jgi:hypothetical protein
MSNGSLLWVHGKRTFLSYFAAQLLMSPYLHSGFGEEHSLVRHFLFLSPVTVLMLTASSAIIQHIMKLRDAGRATLAYFYFDFRDEEKQNVRNAVTSLLIQLSAYSKPCCDIIYHLYSAHGKGTQQPSNGILIDCLKEMLTVIPTPNFHRYGRTR